MTGKNVLKQQLQSGNVSMPSVSGTLKESGAVTFDLTSIKERTRETSRSSFEETETGPRKEGITVKGASSTVNKEEKNIHQQKKQATTGRNKLKQHLQTGKVNMPSVSGAMKESGTVRIVHASIHERPKKKRGSLTQRKKAEKVAFGKGVKTEKKRLPPDSLRQEMRGMADKMLSKKKLQTGNVNMPSASGALKENRGLSYVLVTIHEHPKEASESLSQERETVGMKQGNDNQVAANEREEPGNLAETLKEDLEETHL